MSMLCHCWNMPEHHQPSVPMQTSVKFLGHHTFSWVLQWVLQYKVPRAICRQLSGNSTITTVRLPGSWPAVLPLLLFAHYRTLCSHTASTLAITECELGDPESQTPSPFSPRILRRMFCTFLALQHPDSTRAKPACGARADGAFCSQARPVLAQSLSLQLINVSGGFFLHHASQ